MTKSKLPAEAAIQAAWKLVPIEPTVAMIEAGERAAWDQNNSMPAFRAIPSAWSAMLASSPKAASDAETPIPAGDVITLPRRAAQALLDDLNSRIDQAHITAVPVFAGIVELHDALAASPTPDQERSNGYR